MTKTFPRGRPEPRSWGTSGTRQVLVALRLSMTQDRPGAPVGKDIESQSGVATEQFGQKHDKQTREAQLNSWEGAHRAPECRRSAVVLFAL